MADTTPRVPPRAETVGSFLRPAALASEIAKVYSPRHTALLEDERDQDLERLHEAEDVAIDDLVRRQIDIGLDAITDGEFRRYMFTNSFYDGVEGLAPDPEGVPFYDDEGHEHYYAGTPRIVARLRKTGSPAVAEVEYMNRITDHPFKVTFPAGSFFCLPFIYRNGVTEKVYDTRMEMVQELIDIERQQIHDALRAGVKHIQFDFSLYPLLADQKYLDIFASMGLDRSTLLDECVRADTEVLDGIPEDVRVSMHLCRGNWKSRWMAQGSLEPVAERMFDLPYDSFLVEWEDRDREGGFEPIRHVPKDKVVVMGIVSSKVPAIQTADELVSQIDEAAGFLDVSQLAISPQCGFASVADGNDIDEATQWRKLEAMVAASDRIWTR
jgi:5-methyltetrahydropteroyltriglutamate--homocysteine methyltransferase